nr:hypothetical protein [Tanacetum cinerariifolium]
MITNVIKPKRWISKRYRISPNKTFVVPEKSNTPRSCLRWKSTRRIFKTDGLWWIPTGKMFTDSTINVDCEPLDSSNMISLTHMNAIKLLINQGFKEVKCDEHEQMASAKNTSGLAPQRKERCTLQCALSLKEEKSSYLQAILSTTSKSSQARSVNNLGLGPQLLTPGYISSGLVQNPVSPTPYVPPSKNLFQPLFDEYFNPPPRAISLDPVVIAA